MFKRIMLTASVCVLTLGLASQNLADGNPNPNPGVLPIHSSPYGKTYGEWAAKWWQWIFSIPLATNPQIDVTGDFADIDQSGPVWFLAATFGDGLSYERHVNVPAGKALFFPVVPAVFWAPEDALTEEELRAMAKEAIDGATILDCTLDGVPMEELFGYRAVSPAFVLPDPLLIDFGYDPGDRYPAVADGYWLFLAPLSPGEHELYFYSEFTEGPWAGASGEVTYYLTIEPE